MLYHYEKAYKAFNKLLARSIYTAEAGLQELIAAHHVSSGYSYYDKEAMQMWQSALDRWEMKWLNTPQYKGICQKYADMA